MTTYTATIRHHSIARAPLIQAGDSLRAAKLAATRRFNGGFLDHEIVILREGEIVSRRLSCASRWTDAV